MNAQLIISPIVGGVIGLVTNGIAIKMLFRPLKEVYIGKFKVPFTPGLIPKERDRIAKAIGEVVSQEFLNKETLSKTLLSDEMQNSIIAKFDEKVDKYSNSDMSVKELLNKVSLGLDFDSYINEMKSDIGDKVLKEVIKSNVGKIISDYAYAEIQDKLNPMVMALAGSVIVSVKESLAVKINSMVEEKGPEIIEDFIDEKIDRLMITPIKDVISENADAIPKIRKALLEAYTYVVENKLSSILRSIDLASVIENKINELDLLELEKIILGLMKKELNALVLLGGLLGAIMGFLNVIIGSLVG